MEQPAKGTQGMLINLGSKFVFRVYSPDPNDATRKTYKDFDIKVDDLALEITSDYYTLVDDGLGKRYIRYTKSKHEW
jgi:hypothetical protein